MPTNFNPYQLAGSTIFGPSNYNPYPMAGSQIFGPSNPAASSPIGMTPPQHPAFQGYKFNVADPSAVTMPTVAAPTIPQTTTATSPVTPGYPMPNVTMPQLTMPNTQPTTPAEAQAAVSVADIVNKYNQQNLQGQYESQIPGYKNLVGTSSANTQSLLSGTIPQDVVNQTAQLATERGVNRGITSDSPAANAALMRLYGLTSLDLQNQGEKNLTGIMARTPISQPFDVSSQMVTPAQKLDAGLRLQIAQIQTQAGLTEAQMSAAVALAGQANQMGIAKLDTLSREKIAQLEAQTGLTETQIKVAAEIQNAQLQARVAESGQRNNWNIALMEQELGLTKQQIQNAFNWQSDLLKADVGMAELAAKQEFDRQSLEYGGQLRLQEQAMANDAALQRALIQQGIIPGDNTQIPPFPGYNI